MSAVRRTNKSVDSVALMAAVKDVYDAHGTPAERRISIAGPLALDRARIVADSHAHHNGDHALGSCDAELFALEWEIFLAESPAPKTGWRDRLRARGHLATQVIR